MVIEQLLTLEPGSVAMFRGVLTLSEQARARLDAIRTAMASANGGDFDERYCLELLREELGDPAWKGVPLRAGGSAPKGFRAR